MSQLPASEKKSLIFPGISLTKLMTFSTPWETVVLTFSQVSLRNELIPLQVSSHHPDIASRAEEMPLWTTSIAVPTTLWMPLHIVSAMLWIPLHTLSQSPWMTPMITCMTPCTTPMTV